MKKVERNTKYRKYTNAYFNTLGKDLMAMVDCVDYSESDPDRSLFDILFKRKERVDSLKLRERERIQSESNEETRKKKRKGLLKRMKDLFKK